MNKNVWLALMLMLALCVSKTQAQQKFDQYGYAIELDEEEAIVVDNNKSTPKIVNQNYSQPVADQNTNYQNSGITSTTYSTSTKGCCSHSTTTIVNVTVKIVGGGANNTYEQYPPRIINGTRYVYVNNGNSCGYSSGRQFIPISQFPQFCDNRQWRPRRREESHQTPINNNWSQSTQTTQTHGGTFQNEVHGGQFNNGVQGGSFNNGSSGGTLNPTATTGGGGNGNVHHGKP